MLRIVIQPTQRAHVLYSKKGVQHVTIFNFWHYVPGEMTSFLAMTKKEGWQKAFRDLISVKYQTLVNL